ncbi:MAG: cysteine synthase [Bacteroidetes bacterium GWE2_39_28]|nr:MAG: cysteine synthase [Bacteroidetes bacterium GWE2_39_28]OFY12478.1 MAG: cysteine synthase [Bacteroidetes bacterium GWF2_39_10]OFZ10662.1 MAG: cysteine synthase [Bacteroidetes bacterium RIFOXYC2_FULL_39_11]HCT93427.1 cysteine synthase [Rikenellaceae bacterium]HCV15604.1 cysteine synthase [Rikenellaceae bacterium]
MESYPVQRIQHLSSLVGNTPLLEIFFKYKGQERRIYAKSENLNMTASIKDRMAFTILYKSYKNGSLKPGDTIIEATSGNTGIAFCAMGRAMGHPVVIFMPNWLSVERYNLIQSLGAKINLVTKDEGGFVGSIAMAEKLAKETENSFLPRQFSNENNILAHFETTGPEIWSQMTFRNLMPDAFVAGVGTGGTIMGTGRFLRKMNPKIRLHPLEPANSPTLTTGYKVGSHRIQGISDEFIPSIVKLDELNEVLQVDDGDAIIMAQRLSAELGISVGISSGANFLGALIAQNKIGPDANVVTIFSDCNKKYLSTDLMRQEPVKNGFYSPDIELLSFRSFKRVCITCCNPDECIETYSPGDIAINELPKCVRR